MADGSPPELGVALTTLSKALETFASSAATCGNNVDKKNESKKHKVDAKRRSELEVAWEKKYPAAPFGGPRIAGF